MQIGEFKAQQLDIQSSANEWVCLSLTQPWAQAMFVGLKKIETRGWKTNYRGRLYIHAANGFPRDARNFAAHVPELPSPLPLGCIIGSVELLGMERTDNLRPRISDTEAEWGDYGPRRWGWITENPILLGTPIPAKGSLGLWRFSRVQVSKQENR